MNYIESLEPRALMAIVAVLDTGVDASAFATGVVLSGPGPDGGPDSAHGTRVASVVAEYDSTALILPVRVTGANGAVDPTLVAWGVEYAIHAGATVLNLSFGAFGGSGSAYAAAFADAASAGVVVVCAAGNYGANNDMMPFYPASTPGANVVSVAACDFNGDPASFSDYGYASVTLAAPGVGVTVRNPGGGLDLGSGTSFAAPIVCAAAARVRDAYPFASASQVITTLKAEAAPVASEWGRSQTGGVILNPSTGSVPPLATPPVAAPIVFAAPHPHAPMRHRAIHAVVHVRHHQRRLI